MPSEPARPLPSPDSATAALSSAHPNSPAHPDSTAVDALSPTDRRALRRSVRRELRRRITSDRRGAVELEPIAIFGFDRRRLERLDRRQTNPAAASDSLLGLRVPDRCCAVVAMAASVMTTSERGHNDAVLAVAVSRDGREMCFLASDDGIAETWQPQGWLVDACRRSLGLPTRPATELPVDLSLALWLDYLLVALVEHRAIAWADAVACCPVAASTPDIAPEMLGELLATGVPSWSALRVAAAGGAPLPVPLRADHAAWMDDAMFARWVLGFFPELDDLRSDIEFLAAPDLAADIERAVQRARAG